MTRSNALFVLSLAFSTLLVQGCGTEKTDTVASTEPAPAAAHSPAADIATGEVVETFDAGGYTYVRLDTGDEEIWAAAGEFAVAVGDRVTVPLEMPMANFHSPSLERDFEMIYFASAIVPAGANQAPAAGHGSMMASAHGSSAPAGAQVEAVKPPADGVAIADLWTRRQELSGQKTTVRGTVVKYNGGILGRNWLHIQDGSGDAANGDHDLTVTTDATVEVGQTVTATGVVTLNQDFGSGYAYDLMLTEAVIKVE